MENGKPGGPVWPKISITDASELDEREREEFGEEMLERYEAEYKSGNQSAARDALSLCAELFLVMPAWLGAIVLNAISTSEQGKPDELLGFGNEKMLARWRKESLQRRNSDILGLVDAALGPKTASEFEEIDAGTSLYFQFDGSTAQLIKFLADEYHTSVKNIEKIVYTPTGKGKK
jgi:hypothetical protein